MVGPHYDSRGIIAKTLRFRSPCRANEINGLDDGTVREALKRGLFHKSLFKKKVFSRYRATIQEALHLAKGFIDLEEKNE